MVSQLSWAFQNKTASGLQNFRLQTIKFIGLNGFYFQLGIVWYSNTELSTEEILTTRLLASLGSRHSLMLTQAKLQTVKRSYGLLKVPKVVILLQNQEINRYTVCAVLLMSL